MDPLSTKFFELAVVPFVHSLFAKAGSKVAENFFEDEKKAERSAGETLRPRSSETQDSTGRPLRTFDLEAARQLRLEQRELEREEREHRATLEREEARRLRLERSERFPYREGREYRVTLEREDYKPRMPLPPKPPLNLAPLFQLLLVIGLCLGGTIGLITLLAPTEPGLTSTHLR